MFAQDMEAGPEDMEAGCLCWTIPKQSAQLDQYAGRDVTVALRNARPLNDKGRLARSQYTELGSRIMMQTWPSSGCTMLRMQLASGATISNNIHTANLESSEPIAATGHAPQTEKPTGHEQNPDALHHNGRDHGSSICLHHVDAMWHHTFLGPNC